MILHFSDDFDIQFKDRLSNKEKIQILEKIELFIEEPLHKDLRNHALRDEWTGYRSISVGGDLRLHFKVNEDNVYFVAVGTHDQLYK